MIDLTAKVPMRVTLTFTYEADPKNYGEANLPLQMAGIDQNNLQNDLDHLMEMAGDSKDLKVAVEIV